MTDSVTVIIPTWNRANTLAAAVKSVLAQTHPVLEVLVCDDGSTDNTKEILAELNDPRIKFMEGPRAGRPAVPRNRGIQAANGEWIAFLDSDDAWLPEKLERQLADMRTAPAKASCTNAWKVIPGKGRVGEYLSIQANEFPLATLLKTNFVICSSAVIHKSILNEIGGFPEEEELKAIEDFALWLRVSTRTRFRYIAEPLVEYLDDAANSIRVDTREQVQRENVMRNFYTWYNVHARSPVDAPLVTKALRLAMKNNGRSFLERWKIK
jgi:glycosyltransferase involved in cell wall biosynthesis